LIPSIPNDATAQVLRQQAGARCRVRAAGRAMGVDGLPLWNTDTFVQSQF
jgi:hypothetical protein